MGGITLGGGGFTVDDQMALNERMAKKAKDMQNFDATANDAENVKNNLYYGEGQTPGKDAPYSRIRSPGPSMAKERLDKRGVDTESLITGKPSANEGYKKGGHAQKSHEKINLKHCRVSTHEKNSKCKSF
jgi:hypothetical protein